MKIVHVKDIQKSQPDRKVKVSEIAEFVAISKERVRNILHTEIGMRKLFTRSVPYLPNADQKQPRAHLSQQKPAKGLVINYLGKGRMSREYYYNLLDQLEGKIYKRGLA